MATNDIPTFAAAQLSLLDAELQAELEETSSVISQSSPATLQRAGLAVANLVVSSQRTGLGGKTVIELEPDSAVSGDRFQEHGIRTGDIIRVQEHSGKRKDKDDAKKITGVVTRVRGCRLSVALDKEDEEVPAKRLWVFVAGQIEFEQRVTGL